MHGNAAVIASGNELGAPDCKRAYDGFSLAAAHGLKDATGSKSRGSSGAWPRHRSQQGRCLVLVFDLRPAGRPGCQSARRATARHDPSELLGAKTRLAALEAGHHAVATNIVAINSSDWQATAQN
ncbi:MAG: hypothetical protein U1E15_08145 [Hyphomicrobiales bacterium]